MWWGGGPSRSREVAWESTHQHQKLNTHLLSTGAGSTWEGTWVGKENGALPSKAASLAGESDM